MAEGLREKKRRASQRAMEQAAVDIAYNEGVAAVTVERVCEAAMVSRSTFFNYFTSLMQAIFGPPLEYDPELTERILARHSDDLVIAASMIVMESVRGEHDDDLKRRRFALFVRETDVTSAVSWGSGTSRRRLIDVISAWLAQHPNDSRVSGGDPQTEARITVGLAIALGDEVQRHALEVDGEYPIDLELFRAVRRQMAQISAVGR